MKSCIVICSSSKSPDKKGKILFIDAVKHIRQETNMSYLDPEHILEIAEAYNNWEDVEGFSRVVELDEILSNHSRLSIPLYLKKYSDDSEQRELSEIVGEWLQDFMNYVLPLIACSRYLTSLTQQGVINMEEWPKVRFGDVVQKMNGKIALEERAGKLCVRGEHIPRNFHQMSKA